MAQITYTNKVALNENPEIANINKVTDDDMNEIKQVVNNNYNNTIQITNTEPSDSDWKIWVDSSEQADNTYYNDNGTATQFKATTYDTLPIGTEVDYDGETVPSGWTEIDDYSTTEEVDTGKVWIDGKKIYRKVYVYTTLANQYNIDTGANEIISINGMINRKDYTNIYLPVGGRANETTWATSFGNIQTTSANRINFNYGGSWTSSTFNKLVVILEYTKA